MISSKSFSNRREKLFSSFDIEFRSFELIRLLEQEYVRVRLF